MRTSTSTTASSETRFDGSRRYEAPRVSELGTVTGLTLGYVSGAKFDDGDWQPFDQRCPTGTCP